MPYKFNPLTGKLDYYETGGVSDHHLLTSILPIHPYYQAMKGIFTLPFCYNNGVTRVSTLLTAADVTGDYPQTPCLRKVGNYYYLFYYSGSAALGYKIGVARSTSISSGYTELAWGMIPMGTMLQQRNPCIIYDEYETDSNKRWKAWIYDKDTLTIFYSYSPDPDSGWSTPASIGITDCYYGHSVVKMGNLWYLGYCVDGDKNIDLIVSATPNFATYQNLGEILQKGEAWDSVTVRYFSMTYIMGVLYMVYSGQQGTAPQIQIGLAYSSHYGLRLGTPRLFEKFALNPILTVVAGESYVFAPSLLQLDEKFYIAFTPSLTDGTTQIKLGII